MKKNLINLAVLMMAMNLVITSCEKEDEEDWIPTSTENESQQIYLSPMKREIKGYLDVNIVRDSISTKVDSILPINTILDCSNIQKIF